MANFKVIAKNNFRFPAASGPLAPPGKRALRPVVPIIRTQFFSPAPVESIDNSNSTTSKSITSNPTGSRQELPTVGMTSSKKYELMVPKTFNARKQKKPRPSDAKANVRRIKIQTMDEFSQNRIVPMNARLPAQNPRLVCRPEFE
jgi:hypothetical protein